MGTRRMELSKAGLGKDRAISEDFQEQAAGPSKAFGPCAVRSLAERTDLEAIR
jgi:hypothetical protein